MKILLDMNLTPRWVGFLRERGLEAVRWSEVGLTSGPEANGERLLQVLAAAAEVLEAGANVVMDSRRVRVRPLPPLPLE